MSKRLKDCKTSSGPGRPRSYDDQRVAEVLNTALQSKGTSEKARIRPQQAFHFPCRHRVSQMLSHGKGDVFGSSVGKRLTYMELIGM